MHLPAYWWLLALPVVVQGAFFVRLAVVRLLGRGVCSLSRRGIILLLASGAAGLAYGIVQRDPLFVVGQGCLMLVYYRLRKSRAEDEDG
jgi:lipid-A-disaccharide synthase-like uncharacterized protein